MGGGYVVALTPAGFVRRCLLPHYHNFLNKINRLQCGKVVEKPIYATFRLEKREKASQTQ